MISSSTCGWRTTRSPQQVQIEFAHVLQHAIKAERRRNKRVNVAVIRLTEATEEGFEVARAQETDESGVIAQQLEGMDRPRGNVKEVSGLESQIPVVDEHFQSPVQPEERLGTGVGEGPRNFRPDRPFWQQRDE